MTDYLKPNDRIINKENTNPAYRREEKRIYDKWRRENPPPAEKPIKPVEQAQIAATTINPTFALPATTKTELPVAPAVDETPFMAQNTTAGLPYYGEGDFKGWARKVFAKIFDPKYFNASDPVVLAATKAQMPKIESYVKNTLKWDSWGEKFFGIKASEVAQTGVALAAELASSDNKTGTHIAQSTGIAVRTIGQAVSTGLGLFEALDYAKRKDIALREADEVLFKQTDAYKNLEDSALYKLADKYGAAEYIFMRGGSGNAGVFIEENPILGIPAVLPNVVRSWIQRSSIIADPDTRGIALDTYEQYWRGSSMAYTMVKDAHAKQLFEEAVAAGADPEMAAIENADFWTEVGGSILNDPTTYMGVTLVKGLKIPFTGRALTVSGGKLALTKLQNLPVLLEIPSFGQMLGIGQKAKNLSTGDDAVRAITKAAGNELDRIAELTKGLDKLDNAADQAVAVSKIDEHASKVVKMADNFVSNLEKNRIPNTKVLDTASKKVQMAFQSITNAARMILSKGGTVDERIEVMRAVRGMFRGTEAERKAAVLLVTKDMGHLTASDGVFQLGTMLSKLENDGDIARLVNTAGGSILENEPLIKRLEGIAKTFYPSMDEMADAEKFLAGKGDEIAKAKTVIDDLARQVEGFGTVTGKKPKAMIAAEKALKTAQSAFDSAYGKEAELKALYDKIPETIKKGRAGLRAYENIPFVGSKAVRQYMNTVYLALRPAQTARQIQSQGALIAMDMGFLDMVEIVAKTTLTAFKQSSTESMLIKNANEIQQLLGFKPAKFMQGVATSGEVLKPKGFQGMLRVTQNLDELTSSEVILRTVKREMGKLTGNPKIFSLEKLTADFSKEEVNHLYRLLVEHSGDTNKALTEFKNVAKKGSFDTWRYLPMPEKLLQFTSDTKMLERMNEIQKTAKNQGEFVDGIKKLVEAATEQARMGAAQMPPVIDATAGNRIRELFLTAQDLRNKGHVGEATEKIFTNKVNAYKYMRDNMVNSVRELATQIRAKAIQTGTANTPEFIELERVFNAAQSKWGEFGSDLHDSTTMFTEAMHTDKSVAEIIDLVHTDKLNLEEMTGIGLDELYKMDLKTFRNTVWPAYLEKVDGLWRDENMTAVDGLWSAMEDFSKGLKVDIAELLQATGGNSKAMEYMSSVAQYRQEAKVWENYAKFFSDNINELASAYGVPTATKVGAPMDKQLLATLNKYLPEGMEKFANKADVEARIEDARLAFAKMDEVKNPEDLKTFDKIDELLRGVGKTQPEETANAAGDAAKATEGAADTAQNASKAADDVEDTPKAANFERENKKTLTQIYRETAKKYGWDGKGSFKKWVKGNPQFGEAIKVMNAKVKAWEDSFASMKTTPPVSSPGTSTTAMTLYQNLTDYKFKGDIQAWVDNVSDAWGTQGQSARLSPQRERVLMEFMEDTSLKMTEAKRRIVGIAEQARDNILLSYDKSYGDIAGAYFKPYHYWQTHQTMNTVARFVDHPSWANGYMKYKEAMANDHKDLPDWWKYNIEIKHLPGIDLKNPVFVNLESAINPIYDLTGVDFEDPYKRVDWISRAVDDAGKVGGSFTPVIQWAVALNLYDKGQDEAASRWVGRPTGQTSTAVKAMLNKFGMDVNLGKFIQHNEIDPAVNFLMGGLDPQERKRVGKAMTAMINEGLSPEAALQAMNFQDGENATEESLKIWNEAVRRSTGARADTELMSYFAGTNWKPRTQQDAEIDIFYKDYYNLRNQRDMMTPEQYRGAWDKLREDNRFMDSLLLSGKNTDDRNSAYTYNVLGRIPTGDMSDVLKKFGVSNAQISSFYENKGDFTGWTNNDKDRFLSAINDLGAFLSIPSGATKQEWDAARTMRKNVDSLIAKRLDIPEEDLQGLLQAYYDIPASQTGQKDAYKQLHPYVQDYLDLKAAYIANNPLLGSYYGGIGMIESYQKGIVRSDMEKKYGQGIMPEYYAYLDMFDKGREQYKKDNPEFANFLKEYYARLDNVSKYTVQFADKYLVDKKSVDTWQDPQSATQQEMLDTLSPQTQQISFTEWRQALGEPTTEVIMDYWRNDEPIPYQVTQKLEKMANDYGFEDGESMLQAILMSMP